VPLSPSPADLYSTVAMIRMIESMRAVRNPQLSSALMLNSVNGKTKMREEILKILRAEEIGEHLLDSQIAQREVYRQTFALGTTIHHHNRYLKGLKEARAEIERLVTEMAQYIASTRATGAAHG
jgi:chromosome partitioning protein